LIVVSEEEIRKAIEENLEEALETHFSKAFVGTREEWRANDFLAGAIWAAKIIETIKNERQEG
jgi:hypothetical protein